MRTARALGAAAAAFAVVLAGCGGGGRLSKAEYEQTLRSAGNELSTAVDHLQQARSKEEFEHDVSDVQRALDAAADDLDAVSPPEDVEGANDRLVHGLRGLAHDFEEVRDAADQSVDAATSKAQQIRSGTASREAQQAVEELKRKGYDIGTFGS